MAINQDLDMYCFDLSTYYQSKQELKEIAEYIKSKIDTKFDVTILENYDLQIVFPTNL